MSDQLVLLRDLIHERTGLFFPDGRVLESLEGRLSPLLEKSGCGSLSGYHEFLRDEPDSGEWLDLITALSKPVSSFLRAGPQIKALVDTVIPEFLSNGPIKIWSAGCATGEEPLSIAIALSDAAWFDRADIQIYASDASTTALESARLGLYSELRMRYVSPEMLDKYFEPAGDGWRVKQELHERIRWSVTNLVNENEVAELAASQIVFCRNVFIYFSDAVICKTLGLFGKYMPVGGYLFTDGGDHFTSLVKSVGILEELGIDGIPVWRKHDDNTCAYPPNSR
jgi:chemotaxis protein methyltransferase CheR